MNTPPDIYSPADPTTQLKLVYDQHLLQVRAADADGDPIHFLWENAPPDAVEDVIVQEGFTLGVLKVNRDPLLDGTQIRVVVTDLREGPVQIRRWDLEVN